MYATLELMRERGFACEVTEVARRAEVGAGTVYRHFESKERLLGVIVSEVIDKTRADLTGIAASTKDAQEAIRQTMEVGFARVATYGQLAIEMTAGVHPPVYPEVDAARAEMQALFAALMRRGIEQGYFRANLDVEYAVAVWFALVAPDLLTRLSRERSVEELASLTTDFLLAGLRGIPNRLPN